MQAADARNRIVLAGNNSSMCNGAAGQNELEFLVSRHPAERWVAPGQSVKNSEMLVR
jgi:hypothetical protein